MSKEVEDPLSPPAGAAPLSPPAGGGVSGEEYALLAVQFAAISRSFYRYQPFGKPLVAAQQGYNMQ